MRNSVKRTKANSESPTYISSCTSDCTDQQLLIIIVSITKRTFACSMQIWVASVINVISRIATGGIYYIF